jgi:hypothetical protein
MINREEELKKEIEESNKLLDRYRPSCYRDLSPEKKDRWDGMLYANSILKAELKGIQSKSTTKTETALQKEYDRHTAELTYHKSLIEQNDSKKQHRKFWKHFHKRWEVERIAELLGVKLNKETKIDYNKIWKEYEEDTEKIKNFHITNLEKDLDKIKNIYLRKVNMRRA